MIMPINNDPLDNNNNNNTKLFLEDMDSDPGYFNQVIRPMFAPGHDTELIFWLRNMGLIHNSPKCIHSDVNKQCNSKFMEWIPVKSSNIFQWKCPNCNTCRNIRKCSIFDTVRFISFKNGLRIILGWCKGYGIDFMATLLGVKMHIVRSFYDSITAVGLNALRKRFSAHKIGGPGVIVLIDAFSELIAAENTQSRTILCISEAKNIPPRFWFELLPKYRRRSTQQINQIVEYNLRVIEETVAPGSILVTQSNSSLCSYGHLQKLRHLYPIIVSSDDLARHNTFDRTITQILDTIWSNAVEFCQAAQYLAPADLRHFITGHLWRNMHQDEAFEHLIHTMTDMQF